MTMFGLPECTLQTLRTLLAEYPAIEAAVIYGSRAMGTHQPGSDIDLTLIGANLDEQNLSDLAGRLDESDIPYRVDLSLHKQLDNRALLQHIARVGQVLYQRG